MTPRDKINRSLNNLSLAYAQLERDARAWAEHGDDAQFAEVYLNESDRQKALAERSRFLDEIRKAKRAAQALISRRK